MDNLTPSRTQHHHQPLHPPPSSSPRTGFDDVSIRSAGPTTTTRLPLLLNSDVIELGPPPPRLPPRGERASQTDAACGGSQRPCPPLPPGPPQPPAPPLPAREPLRPVSPAHLTSRVSDRHAPPLLLPDSVRPPPLDQIVPHSHWPLPTSSVGRSRDRTRLAVEPPRVHAANVTVVNQMPRPPPQASHHVVIGGGGGNLYVDAPTLRRTVVGSSNNAPASPGSMVAGPLPPRQTGNEVVVDHGVPLQIGDAARRVTPTPAVIVTQPTSSKPAHCLDAPPSSSSVLAGGGPETVKKYGDCGGGTRGPLNCRGVIVCSRCGRCRCANCTAPRELPRRWIGDFECSLQRCVNVTTCLCCVEGIFYHCLDGSEETCTEDGTAIGATDDPCACCDRPRCCVRWTIMAAMAALMPCLCCYCPMQCALEALTSCYNACDASRGCRCPVGSQEASSSGGSTRGLLAESESSST